MLYPYVPVYTYTGIPACTRTRTVGLHAVYKYRIRTGYSYLYCTGQSSWCQTCSDGYSLLQHLAVYSYSLHYGLVAEHLYYTSTVQVLYIKYRYTIPAYGGYATMYNPVQYKYIPIWLPIQYMYHTFSTSTLPVLYMYSGKTCRHAGGEELSTAPLFSLLNTSIPYIYCTLSTCTVQVDE